MDRHENFIGTYFNKDTILRLASAAKILSWVVAAIYLLIWLGQLFSMITQITRGFWQGIPFPEVFQSIFLVFKEPLPGLVYFIVLQGTAQVLLMVMDVEDNTRRVARDFQN